MPKIRYRGSTVEIETPYNDLWLNEIRNRIPADFRKWDPDRRLWTIWNPYVHIAVEITLTYFPNTTTVGEDQFNARHTAEQERLRQERRERERADQERRRAEDLRREQKRYSDEARREREENDRREKERQKRNDDFWEDFRRTGGFGGFGQNTSGNASGSSQTNGTSSGDFRVLFVCDDAPEAVCRAAFKALALVYHPDRAGGDTRKMQALNGAWDNIRKRKGWK